MTMLQKSISRPIEQVLRYPCLSTPPETTLFATLNARFGDLPFMAPMLEQSKQLRGHLGRWCSDVYWKLALSESKTSKAESQAQKSFYKTTTGDDVGLLDTKISQTKAVIATIKDHDYTTPKIDSFDFSAKVLQLHNYLRLYFERPSDHRCIVFVEQRLAARLLSKAFESIGGPYLQPGFLCGSGSGELADLKSSFRSQVMTLIKFRNGELNCLFATSVAEEGLDVPDCNLVIRFDICQTMIKYVQSRGRARHKHSKFIHMIETGVPSQDRLLQEHRQAENLMRRFCEALPKDRHLAGNDDLSESLACSKDANCKAYIVESTGAKITYTGSLAILAHFVSSLPNEGDEVLQPFYILSPQAGKFQCEVVLPACSPIRGVVGDLSSKKALAKCSAAFNACVELREKSYLDENLLPVYKKALPVMRNAALALNMGKHNMYSMRLKPSLWEDLRGTVPDKLHLLLVDFSDKLDRSHQPLVLLSRHPLPVFPTFPLYLNSGRQSNVITMPVADPIVTDQTLIHRLTVFTLCIFKDVFTKTYESADSAAAKMSYWIVPASRRVLSMGVERFVPSEMIDWAALDAVEHHKDVNWVPGMATSSVVDRFLIHSNAGGHKYFADSIASGYKPSDPMPPDLAPPRFTGSILEYSEYLGQVKRRDRPRDPNQPVLEVEKVPYRLNMLAELTDKDRQIRAKYLLCPEPLRISALSTGFVTTCVLFPAIISRIESYLIGAEICQSLQLEVDLALALEAITKDSDNSDDHHTQERINFQRGMGKNYERLELLGDCFLKMATSISVFIQNPNDNEFEFHVKRMLLLCNQNLYNVSREKRLYEYIRSQSLSRRTWYPEGLTLLEGKGKNKTGEDVPMHQLGDKTIADVSESLMGAAFLTHNRPGSWTAESWRYAVRAVTLLVGNADHTMLEWSDYRKAYAKPAYQVAEATASHLDLAEKAEAEHPYHFRYPRLLRSAFLHPSYPQSWEKVPSYQRLEFLGDALLDMACVTHLFYRYPGKDPQWLTEHKMAMVANRVKQTSSSCSVITLTSLSSSAPSA